jgi:glycosyltransferase involved in cell wall biosynthesis
MMEGMGFVFTTGDNPGFARRLLQWATMWLFRLSLSFADRLILLNDDDYQTFVGRRLVAPAKATVLGGIGVDLAEWQYSEPVRAPITFAFVGRLLRDKGVEEFAAAARILRGKGYDARFVMLGGHDSNPTAIPLSTVEGWVAEGIVEWPGYVDVRPALQRASVFVLPSYREGVPRSTQEAMALGLPIVTTDVPGCRETVVEGKNGFLVPAQDAAALAKAMENFLLNPDRIVPMGRESRRIAEQQFDVHNQNRKLLKLIGL